MRTRDCPSTIDCILQHAPRIIDRLRQLVLDLDADLDEHLSTSSTIDVAVRRATLLGILSAGLEATYNQRSVGTEAFVRNCINAIQNGSPPVQVALDRMRSLAPPNMGVVPRLDQANVVSGSKIAIQVLRQVATVSSDMDTAQQVGAILGVLLRVPHMAGFDSSGFDAQVTASRSVDSIMSRLDNLTSDDGAIN